MTDLTKIGAAYIRVSDERQDEYSPDSQLKKIREHAERNLISAERDRVLLENERLKTENEMLKCS